MTFMKGIAMETCVVIYGRIVLIDENGLTRAGVRDYFHSVGVRWIDRIYRIVVLLLQ